MKRKPSFNTRNHSHYLGIDLYFLKKKDNPLIKFLMVLISMLFLCVLCATCMPNIAMGQTIGDSKKDVVDKLQESGNPFRYALEYNSRPENSNISQDRIYSWDRNILTVYTFRRNTCIQVCLIPQGNDSLALLQYFRDKLYSSPKFMKSNIWHILTNTDYGWIVWRISPDKYYFIVEGRKKNY